MSDFPSDVEVPRLSANTIELKAEEVIEFFDRTILDRPTCTAITTIVDQTSTEYGVQFETRDLGHTASGRKILGAFQFSPRGIFIDATVVGTERHSFTLAHEFGHLVLHRRIRITKRDYAIRDTEHDLVTGKRILRTAREWIEWQANRFAAAILMPRITFQNALVEAQRSLGVLRNVGIVYLDDQAGNFRDFMSILTTLSGIYQVNKTNVRYRLADLALLIDHRDKDSAHVSELLMEEHPAVMASC